MEECSDKTTCTVSLAFTDVAKKGIIMKISILTLLFVHALPVLAQQTDTLRSNTKVGIFGGVSFNIHSADFQNLPGIPNCCPRFESGSGSGLVLGALFEQRLSSSFWLGVRGGLQSMSGVLSKKESVLVIVPTGPVNGAFEHRVDATLTNLGIEPSLIYNPFGRFSISAGPRLGYLVQESFEQREAIVQPSGFGTFADENGQSTGRRTRNEFSGSIPDVAKFQVGAVLGLAQEFPMNKKGSLVFAPELSLHIPLTTVIAGTDWSVTSIRLGLALKYVHLSGEPQPEPAKPREDVPAAKPVLPPIRAVEKTVPLPKAASVSVVGVQPSGTVISEPKIVIEEFVSNRLNPLLGYIFFDENSASIPDRYRRLAAENTDEFQPSQLAADSTLGIYYNILNIVGFRLKNNPQATLTLTGTNADRAAEAGNTTLSKSRAESVRDYLVRVWNIAPGRIKVQSRNLPEKPSLPVEESDKAAENRRVELSSSSPEILSPVFVESVERNANPPVLRFRFAHESIRDVSRWTLRAWQQSDSSKPFVRTGTNLPDSLDWELALQQRLMPTASEPIEYSLATEVGGEEKIAYGRTLPLQVITVQQKREQRQGDYVVDRYNLILFDFDGYSITEEQNAIIDFIRKRISPQSEIEIEGYTDRTGNAEYNKRLADRRAAQTKDALRQGNAAVVAATGERLYPNDYPEGRFYCRTVAVTVRTKVQ